MRCPQIAWLACFLAACACSKSTDESSLSRELEGKFTFIDSRWTHAEVVDEVMQLDKSGLHQLTANSTPEKYKIDPVWLADGEWVCYATRDTCFCPAVPAFSLIRAVDGQVMDLPEEIRSGDVIRFSSSMRYAAIRDTWHVHVYAVDPGFNITHIASWPTDTHTPLEWSNVGDILLFTYADLGDQNTLALFNPLNGSLKKLYVFGSGDLERFDRDYGFSHDDKSVFFMHYDDLCTIDTNGSNFNRRITPDADEEQMAWSPTGPHLAISRNVKGAFFDELVLYDVMRSTETVLFPANQLEGWIDQIHWSSDGSEIAFTLRGTEDYGLYIISSSGAGLRKIYDQVPLYFDWY